MGVNRRSRYPEIQEAKNKEIQKLESFGAFKTVQIFGVVGFFFYLLGSFRFATNGETNIGCSNRDRRRRRPLHLQLLYSTHPKMSAYNSTPSTTTTRQKQTNWTNSQLIVSLQTTLHLVVYLYNLCVFSDFITY